MAENVGGIYYSVTLDTADMIRKQREVDSIAGQAARSFNAITAAVKLYVAALALVKAVNMAEEFRLLKSRVDIAAGSVEKGTDAWRELQAISKTTQTALEANAQVFTRLNQSILELGGTQRDTLQLTDLLGKAIKVSGASATESKAAMLQFAQALGSGKLAGDELRSLLENAPYLMRKLAEGLGVPIGQLKALGEQGKLTSDVVVNALNKAASSIERDFGKLPQTFSGALTAMQDAAARAAESLDTVTGSSAVATGVIKGLTEVIESLAMQFEAAADESERLGRNSAVETWANRTRLVLSYVVDVADLVRRTFQTVGTVIGGVAAKAESLATLDPRKFIARNAEINEAVRADMERIWGGKFAGEKIRQQLEALALTPEPRREVADRRGPSSNLRSAAAADAKGQARLEARRLAAQAYYEGLVADQKTAMERIDAEEQKALTENARRLAADRANHDIYAKAKVAITAKYARERALLEEQNVQQIAEFRIATTVDEVERIEAIRDEEIRRAQAQQRLGVLTAEQAEREIAAARFRSAQAFGEVAERNARARADAQIAITRSQERTILLIREEAIRQAESAYMRGRLTFEEAEAAKAEAVRRAEDQMAALRRQRQDVQAETLQIRASAGGVEDEVALIRAQAQQRLAAVEEARQRDLEASQVYADQKVAIEAEMHRRIAEARVAADMAALSSMSSAFGAMTDVLRNAGKEQSGIFKALFLAQKAFSIASSIVAIQQGIANASALPYPANLAAMAQVIAATASIISTIQGTNYGGGRRYGGPVSAGSLYRVNESGRPEMFTARNGAQYMLPTQNGSVTPAGAAARDGSRAQTVSVSAPISITVQGVPDPRTQEQVAADLAMAIQEAIDRGTAGVRTY